VFPKNIKLEHGGDGGGGGGEGGGWLFPGPYSQKGGRTCIILL